MKYLFALVFLAGLVTASQLASAAEIIGTVTLKGTPPPEIEITPLENDPTCGKLHKGKVTTHFYVIGPNHGLANVVVKLNGIRGKSTGASAPPVVLVQKGCLFHPEILAIQTHQKLEIKNLDPVVHNVRTTPTVPGNPVVNKMQLVGGPPIVLSFPKPENFLRIKCDVHPWMFAWVTVVDNPYFAVTGKDGHFKIENVPPGTYTIEAMHRKAGNQTKKIVVKPGAPAKVSFTLQVP